LDVTTIRRDEASSINNKGKLSTKLFQHVSVTFVKILVLKLEYVSRVDVSFCTTAAFSEDLFTTHSSTALRAGKVIVIIPNSVVQRTGYGRVEGKVRSSWVHTGSERFLLTVYCNT
jgi:hypothetical protein